MRYIGDVINSEQESEWEKMEMAPISDMLAQTTRALDFSKLIY